MDLSVLLKTPLEMSPRIFLGAAEHYWQRFFKDWGNHSGPIAPYVSDGASLAEESLADLIISDDLTLNKNRTEGKEPTTSLSWGIRVDLPANQSFFDYRNL